MCKSKKNKYLSFAIVGDKAVGKTCLLISHAKKKFPSEYVPKVLEGWVDEVMYNGKLYEIYPYDTVSDQGYYELTKKFIYPDKDLFLVCFSVVDRSSFENVRKQWVPDLLLNCPNSKYLIVGTKTDLREEQSTLARNNAKQITFEEGENLAKELKAVKYVECSALTQEGLENVFVQAVAVCIDNKRLNVQYECKIL